jgi:hypothetical protein
MCAAGVPSCAGGRSAAFIGLGPLVVVVVLHSALYDGWRQLYFIYPVLLLLALRGLVTVWRWRPSWPMLRSGWQGG